MKATFVLPSGTKVEVDGETAEVQALLERYTTEADGQPRPQPRQPARGPTSSDNGGSDEDNQISEIAVVNRIKEDDALSWLHDIIDSRNVLDRVLLPLFVVNQIDSRADGLTSGFISRVFAELGVRLAVPNVSTVLSGKAKRYVLADSSRRKGTPVRYKISRAGMSYLEQQRRD